MLRLAALAMGWQGKSSPSPEQSLPPESVRNLEHGELLLTGREFELVSHWLVGTRGHLQFIEEDEAAEGARQLNSRLSRASRSRSRSPRASLLRRKSSQTQLREKEAKKEKEKESKSKPAGSKLSGWVGPNGLTIEDCQVIEVETQEEKKAAYNLHLSKNTFHEERQLVEFRIFRGDICQCRTWVLVPDPRRQAADFGDAGSSGRGKNRGRGRAAGRGRATRTSDRQVYCLAAVTVRINCYANRKGRWAQILNMSTSRERHGFGTMLIAGLEELLKQEDSDVVVLYPAENGRAPAFWKSLGFGAATTSLLPDEELVPHDKGGPLLPEFDPGSQVPLPRWEKRILSRAGSSDAYDGETKNGRGKGRPSKPRTDYRALPASASRIGGADLQSAAEGMKEQRAKMKAALLLGADGHRSF
eukprot:TRINITY_DN49337_c0_g1_i1.p1 TRINITY_DN49337_c0_g1~~TRINITY_DN49337_c0_g1_i1.p1  ORF type:complete len:416 (+),score=75.36 TRINITY_DN49337_c0_g1_i1:63-1310(+)